MGGALGVPLLYHIGPNFKKNGKLKKILIQAGYINLQFVTENL